MNEYEAMELAELRMKLNVRERITEKHLARIADLQIELGHYKKKFMGYQVLVGMVLATIPLGETLAVCESNAALVQYFKDLHAERDELKKRLAENDKPKTQ